MLIYKDNEDVIASVKHHIEKKMAACDRTISLNKAASHATIRALAERAAYSDVLWMMTKYTLESEQDATAQAVP
jgi:hypothetical protein